MDTRKSFGKALKQARKASALTQEDFSDVSSRTYLSTLERGMKSPTLEKIDALCVTLNIHPLSLIALTYLSASKGQRLDRLLDKVKKEVESLR